ncbi:MAG: FtsK/SpoIIIE domain-containing protein, partial [Chloroflexota bacterium]
SSIDSISAQDAEHVARALSSVVMREAGTSGRIPRRVDFLELYTSRRVEDLVAKIERRWQEPLVNGVLPRPVPIGRESLAIDTLIMLDEEHHGPHGVLAGTTGSGKSALLQTLICALALEHDPRWVNFLLIDFKGGSTFGIFESLPHTVGTVTNLDGSIVSRALEALRAETQWRQEFLQTHNARDINQYHKVYDAQRNTPGYEALPHLLIIVDEFAQLAKEMPEFMHELVRTAQVGRSLGLHLILGTQSPMDVITDEMNANLQFRICLRVQNIEASRAMLRRPDAAFLPTDWRGRGYFQVGAQGMFKQFQAANVVMEYDVNPVEEDEVPVLELITGKNRSTSILATNGNGKPPIEAVSGEQLPSVAEVISKTIAEYAQKQGIAPMRPILLPPLEDSINLGDIFTRFERGGWDETDWMPAGLDEAGKPIPLGSAPVGLVDDVYNRQQNLLWLHLNATGSTARRDGHVLIIGSPGSGKSMFMRTLALSLALLHPPNKLHLYFLSLTGSGLDSLGNLPHAERVIHGTETERVRRLFGRLIQTLNTRQASREASPIIVVFIDQFEQFREIYRDTFYSDFERLLQEGRAVGIFLVVSVSTADAMPDRLRSIIQQRIALQMGDSLDYLLTVGRISNTGPVTLPPGQGYIYASPPLLCQLCLPALNDEANDEQAATDALDTLIGEMRADYQRLRGLPDIFAAQAPAPIRELPLVIPLNSLPEERQPSGASPVITAMGRRDDDPLSVFQFNWWENGPHLIVTGPPGSGKTNLLYTAAFSAARRYSPTDLRFLLVDFGGRSLRGLDGLKHVIARVTDTTDLRTQLTHLQNELNTFSAQARRDESATFPATIIMIDDYDLTSEAVSSEMLAQLRDHVRLHSDFGLYIWVGSYLERTSDPLIKQLLLRRSGFGLNRRESLQKLNVRTTNLSADAMPEGRAFVLLGNQIDVVQIAIVNNMSEYVQQINGTWRAHDRADWRNPASDQQLRQSGGAAPANSGASVKASSGGGSGVDIDTQGLIDDLLGRSSGES